MPKNSVTPVEGDPYDEMRKKIRSNRPKRWPLVIGLFTLVGGILFAYLSGYTLTKRFSPAVWPSQVWWAVGEVGVEYAIAGAEFGLLVLVLQR